MRALAVSIAVTASVATWAPRPADACSPFVNDPYETDDRDGTDVLPPGPVTASAAFRRIDRDPDDMCALGGGTLEITASAADDHSAVLGFVVRGVDTTLPSGAPGVPGALGTLIYYLRDDAAPAFVDLAAVDRAGNQGPWTQVAVRDVSPPDEGGCSAGGGGGGSAATALVVLGLFAGGASRARRRRGRGGAGGGILPA